MLVRLRSQSSGLSRNRNFELFENPVARRALRLHLMLRKLEKDLIDFARAGTARIKLLESTGPGESLNVLQIDHPGLKLKRRIFLSSEELALLRQSPQVAKILLGN
jgi:hypothetical protein